MGGRRDPLRGFGRRREDACRGNVIIATDLDAFGHPLAREQRREGGPGLGRQSRGLDVAANTEDDLAVGERPEPGGGALVEREPDGESSENLRLDRVDDQDRHRDNVDDPVLAGRGDLGEDRAARVGDDQQVRAQLLTVVFGDRLHRRRIVERHRCLEARKVGDQRRFTREVFEEQVCGIPAPGCPPPRARVSVLLRPAP